MLNGLAKLFFAALIAFGIVTYVTGGDYTQVKTAATEAMDQAMARKRGRAESVANPEVKVDDSSNVISVVTRVSTAQPLSSSLKMTGATKASRRVEVRAETSGIASVVPRKGTRVRKGDLLCRIEMGNRKARREAALSRLNQSLVEARAQDQLSKKGFAAANSSSAAKSDAEVLRADIMQLDIEIDQLLIRAPFDGVVEEVAIEIGGLLQTGNACATIVDPDPLKVVGFVPEFRVGDVRLGSSATTTLVTGQSVRGAVSYIAQTADTATRTFEVEIDVPNPSYALRDSVTTEIEIPLREEMAHKLPQSALTLNDNGDIGVMIVEANKATFRKANILRDGDNGVWISGLGNTSEVIVVGQEYVSEGSDVSTSRQTDTVLGTRS